MKVMVKGASGCIPTILRPYHPSIRINFSIISSCSLKLPHSSLSFSLSRRDHPTTTLLLTNNQNARSLSLQCRCTNVENLAETITDCEPRTWKQYVPKLETIWMLFWGQLKNAWCTISNVAVKSVLVLSAIIFTIKIILRPKKKEPMNVSYDELVGVDAAKMEFRHIIAILQGKSEYKKLGAELPDGVLLYGSQGTGKTTLVHAVAREARVSFFPVSAKDIAKAGTRSVRIKSLFFEARIYSPSIVLIEDVDVIARKGTCESDPALHQLHSEMESCYEDGSMVMVIVSTNKPETLDPDLMTPRWFFTKVHVGLPDEDSKRKIVGLHLIRVVREEDKEAICDLVASRTPGLVWADIKSIAAASKRYAVYRGDDHVTMDDVLRALEMLKCQ